MEQSESLVDKMRPHQILFNRRQAGEKLTDEENAILDAGFPVQQAHDALIKALDEHDAKTYFVPDIIEIRVGYEYEWNIGSKEKPSWRKFKVSTKPEYGKSYPNPDWDVITFQIARGNIKVPYLTKEQIEAEGWAYIPEYEATLLWGAMRYKKDNLIIVHDFNKHTISIHIYKEDEYIRSKVLDIECKDINTFRYIFKLINIK